MHLSHEGQTFCLLGESGELSIIAHIGHELLSLASQTLSGFAVLRKQRQTRYLNGYWGEIFLKARHGNVHILQRCKSCEGLMTS